VWTGCRGEVHLDGWPFAIPAVAQLIEQGGLEVPPGVTTVVGENGSGKSTIVEARAWSGERLQERSHGESFLAVLRNRFDQIGVYFLDEPEAALSFRSCLGLVALLDVLRGARSG
jgi:predicted ATPase